MKKFFMNAVTVLTQILLVKLSFMIMIAQNNAFGIILAISLASTAAATPRFLSEFMLVHGGGGSITNTVYHVSRLAQMAKAAVMKSSSK
jgi:hypothetical protein